MNKRLYDFKRIIRECNYDNTYKVALAKALVELSIENNKQEDPVVFTTGDFAYKFLKYYWNHTIYFDLIQGSNLKKKPVILQLTKELIELYFEKQEARKPERFEKAETFLEKHLKDEYDQTIKKIASAITENVAWRFTRLGKERLDDVFVYDEKKKEFTVSRELIELLKEESEDLFDLIDYRWGLILETFNSSPRINKKVKIIDQDGIKRNDLKKFRKLLDVENPNRICFICGKQIDEKELSIDHVIPWSYMYSDDLWNLVYVHKNCNSSKSDVIPSQEEIDKLKERNDELFQILKEREESGKAIDELEVAIEKDYVDKFWIGCKQ